MGKFFRKIWPLVVVVILSGFAVWPLFMPGYFSHHDDLQVMRIFEMRKCFSDLQFPCRWVPDMGYGNGYPLFNFYGVFPYYLGAILSFIIGYINSAKALFLIPLLGGAVAMYFLAKEIFGKIPGLVAGILFLFAPYHALDAYVRGDVAESFAVSLVPLILYFILKLIRDGKVRYFVFGTLSFSAFLITHNISTLIFSPLVALFSLYFLHETKWKNWKGVVWIFILSLGLSAFFTLPAYFEKNLVQTEALTRSELDFRAQFVKVGQLFLDRTWSYSGSNPQANDTISYQIGWPHWWIVVLSVVIFLVSKKRKQTLFFALLCAVFVFGVFMTHNKSAPIWEFAKILIYVQFPWRFLSFAVFSASLLGAYFVSHFKGKTLWILGLTIVVSTVTLNWRYFRPEHFYYGMTDAEKLSGQNFIDQEKGALLDYLPKTALEPREPAPTSPIVVSGESAITNYINRSNRFNFNIKVTKDSVIDIPVYDFPGWTTYVGGNMVQHKSSYPSGRIEYLFAKGEYKASGVFKNTPIRAYSNTLSLMSFVAFLFLVKYGKDSKVFV